MRWQIVVRMLASVLFSANFSSCQLQDYRFCILEFNRRIGTKERCVCDAIVSRGCWRRVSPRGTCARRLHRRRNQAFSPSLTRISRMYKYIDFRTAVHTGLFRQPGYVSVPFGSGGWSGGGRLVGRREGGQEGGREAPDCHEDRIVAGEAFEESRAVPLAEQSMAGGR